MNIKKNIEAKVPKRETTQNVISTSEEKVRQQGTDDENRMLARISSNTI